MRGWEPRTQRAVYQSFTLVMQIWALTILVYLDPLPPELVGDLALALPVVLVSVLAGSRCSPGSTSGASGPWSWRCSPRSG